MQIQKSIQIFLQKNNLLKSLQLFKNQSKHASIHYGPNKTSTLANIHKFTITNTNEHEIREHFQRTDQNTLKRVVKKLKRKNKTQTINPQITNITKMNFFRKLVEKENQNNSNVIDGGNTGGSDLKESRSFNNVLEESRQYQNQWFHEDDIGFQAYECQMSKIGLYSQQIVNEKNINRESLIKYVQFPQAYYQAHSDKLTKIVENFKDLKKSRLPAKTIFKRQQNQDVYPLQESGITYDSYDLKIVYDREKTGFQEQRQLPIVINEVLAARYQVVAVLGQAQFSKAIQVVDLQNNKNYCIKIIQNRKDQNSKDYLDQSIDQIKLLRFIAANCNPDEYHLLTLHDFFYHKEHLMLVTQLLKDNLYDAYKMRPKHFDLPALRTYSRQILKALQKLHSLHIIHTDLKPQNILIKSYSKQQLKVIDIGSSIFFHDKLSFYIQTRSYRSPQVILGIPYDDKIDIWSFGCIIAELWTGNVLFQSQTVGGLLAKMQGLRGPWPSWMIERGKNVKKHFTKDLLPFDQVEDQQNAEKVSPNLDHSRDPNSPCRLYVPRLTNLKARLNCQDKLFIDFISKCLKLDPTVRMSAKQALKHPFLTQP